MNPVTPVFAENTGATLISAQTEPISDDGLCSIVAGIVFRDGTKLDCRMYLTEEGTEIAHSQDLVAEPRIDMEKQTTH
jgi:hypothetical protein